VRPVQSDADFLGLVDGGGPGRYQVTVQDHLARLDGRLYGGTAIAVSITAAELVSHRPALWMTTQFVSTAPPGEVISVHAEVLAPGRRTNQVRVTGTNPAGEIMFASLGATGHHRAGGLDGTFENPPVVSPPDRSEPWTSPVAAMVRRAGVRPLPPVPTDVGFASVIEFREPVVHHHPDPGQGRMAVWVRRRDRVPVTPALVAFIADMVPMSVAVACGVVAAGISLDNSIRIGAFEETEWVLVDLRPHLAVGDYGHGAAHIWSEGGRLLATASQSASMRRFDGGTPPWVRDQPPGDGPVSSRPSAPDA
jgi:acyl-CoA thioesterase